MQREEQAILIAVFTVVLLCAILIVLFSVFQKRKNALIEKQKESEKRFEKEISKMQIEIREETFRNISWELHDNIGQLLTLAKIQLQNATNVEEVIPTLNKGLIELRALSKSISPEVLNNTTLVEAIHQEIERLNKMEYLKANLEVQGEEIQFSNNIEIVFFRIVQEFLSNTIKHAQATSLTIILNYDPSVFVLTAKDNGKGLSNVQNHTGMGMKNIVRRAELIQAKATFSSVEDQGTQLTIVYPLNP